MKLVAKKRTTKEIEDLLLDWAANHPEIIDQPDNEALTHFYLFNFCKLISNPVGDLRLEEYKLETITRVLRKMVSSKRIHISEENKKARGIKEESVREEYSPKQEVVKPKFDPSKVKFIGSTAILEI